MQLAYLLLLLACGIHHAQSVPAQWFYSEDNVASSTVSREGCTVKRWNGTDADGIQGYPWFATINCPPGKWFEDHGVTLQGMLRFYIGSGQMQANGRELRGQGSSWWFAQGVQVNLRLTGSVSVVGGSFELNRSVKPATFTSSYGSASARVYSVADALAGVNNASNVHDIHINNGTTHVSSQSAHDLLWSSQSSVDPPSIAVLNCAPDGSHVLPHSHPAGALYLPFTGRICFQTDEVLCTEAGYARWTSPNLFYYETFHKTNASNAQTREATELVAAAGITDCIDPVIFGVTNFDPDNSFGQPNFVDVPENARGGIDNFTWGTFRSLAVRSTTVVTHLVELDL